MSNSLVDISNRALSLIGASRINSLDEAKEEARACKGSIDKAIECTLQAHKWNCATFRTVLAADATPPAFEYTNRFLLPSNPRCIRPLSLYGSDSNWKQEGRYILCNDDVLYLVYIGYIEDPNQFDPLLSDAISKRLAYDIAGRLTKEATTVERMFNYFAAAIKEAKGIDAITGTADPIVIDSWLGAYE